MQKLRSLGWWQPFGSLMLPPYNKIETRIPSMNPETGKERKLPMPLGPYLIYTTKKSTPDDDLTIWCGDEIYHNIKSKLANEPTAELNGYAIGIGELVQIYDMKPEDEAQCFILWKAERDCLVFKNVYRIEPFAYKFGKQGVGFVPESEMEKIKLIINPSTTRDLMLKEIDYYRQKENDFTNERWKSFYIGAFHISNFNPGGMPQAMLFDFYSEVVRWYYTNKSH